MFGVDTIHVKTENLSHMWPVLLNKRFFFLLSLFAPLGCKVEAHVTPGTRETWAAHTTSGYYTENAWEHYRCHEVYVSSTKATRVCETVFSDTNT